MADFNELINGDLPLLVDFHAVWCGPCKALSPIIENVAKKLDGQVKVVKIDIDKNQRLAAQYGIRSVPTLILFKDGQILWRQGGVVPESMIISTIKNYI